MSPSPPASSSPAELTPLFVWDREELFYQLGLRQFGSLVRIKLRPPPPLRDLLGLAVDHADGVGATSLPPEEIVDVSVSAL